MRKGSDHRQLDLVHAAPRLPVKINGVDVENQGKQSVNAALRNRRFCRRNRRGNRARPRSSGLFSDSDSAPGNSGLQGGFTVMADIASGSSNCVKALFSHAKSLVQAPEDWRVR